MELKDNYHIPQSYVSCMGLIEDYACIGIGYTKYNKYDISSNELSENIGDSHPIRTSCFSPKGDCFAIGTIVKV